MDFTLGERSSYTWLSTGDGCSSGDAGSFARRLVAPRSSVLTLDLTPIEFSVVSQLDAV